jgi:hypothetical protein
MQRILLLLALVALVALAAFACATTSPMATRADDRQSLAGVWEEEWPGQQTNDRYRIEVGGDKITITPLTNADTQKVRDVVFRGKTLDFIVELEGGAVYYNLVLVSSTLLSGRAHGGPRNFDEPVRWYKAR